MNLFSHAEAAEQHQARRRRDELIDPRRVEVWTDGACSGNPGPGGWAAILIWEGVRKELCGGEAHTTNNRMEMMAAISALEALKRPCPVLLHTDSQYVQKGATEWSPKWKKNGWRRGKHDATPIANDDLWRRLDEAAARHQVTWKWVRGHVGVALNERADALAREAITRFKAKSGKGSP